MNEVTNKIKINHDNSEIIFYDAAGIPIYIRETTLSSYADYRALCHWHKDVEIICILDGSMSYYINGNYVLLKKGDCIIINSGRLHYGYSDLHKECHFYCILLHPSLLTTNKKLEYKFIYTVTKGTSMDYFLFHNDEEISGFIRTIIQNKKNPSPFYEMDIIGCFLSIWKRLYLTILDQNSNSPSNMDEELYAQRKMVSYIYQNYTDCITLDSIAAAGNMCRSKCCRIFKKYMGQSPIEFANSYRLEMSQEMLLTTSLSITKICTSCGFNHLSYFTKQFSRKYHMTPRDYRRQSGCMTP